MIDYSLKENWTKTMLETTLENHCVLTEEERESFDRLWVAKLDCEKVTGTTIHPSTEKRLYSKDENGKEENYYILVESNYNLDVDGKDQPDAISLLVGQYVGVEQPDKKNPFEIDSIINVSTEEARRFAQAILDLCDYIEGK